MDKWLEIITDRFGIRPASSKIEAITQLSQPSTVEEVRVLLGMTGYLKKFVPNYSPVLAPISDLLRDSRFRIKKARCLKVYPGVKPKRKRWRNSSASSHPHQSSRYPTGTSLFRLHTDGSETGAGAVLTQIQKIIEKKTNNSICKPPMVED